MAVEETIWWRVDSTAVGMSKLSSWSSKLTVMSAAVEQDLSGMYEGLLCRFSEFLSSLSMPLGLEGRYVICSCWTNLVAGVQLLSILRRHHLITEP